MLSKAGAGVGTPQHRGNGSSGQTKLSMSSIVFEHVVQVPLIKVWAMILGYCSNASVNSAVS